MRPSPPRVRRKSSASRTSPDRPGDPSRRVQSLLGFAVKAGRVSVGFSPTRQALASGDVRFVVAARDLAPRRLEALLRAAHERGVGCLVGWSRVELGALLGRGPTGAVGVTDPELARGMAASVPAQRRSGMTGPAAPHGTHV